MLGRYMEAEIQEQPKMLAGRCKAYFQGALAALSQCRPEVILLAARGSSDNAALYGRYLIEIHLGIPAVLASPSVWTRYGRKIRYPRCLAIGISQSGAAPDVAEVLTALRHDGHTTLAITNTPNSRLTDVAEHSLILDAGAERSVAATKTYSASLLALAQVVRVLGGDLPDPASFLPDDDWASLCQERAVAECGVLLRSEPLFALARGYGFSTANETALKLMECARLACKSFSTADFQHGPKALAGHGAAAVVFGEPADWLRAQGCEVLQAPLPPEPRGVPSVYAPLWDVFFSQWLALTAARHRGLDADDPQFLKKVTETL